MEDFLINVLVFLLTHDTILALFLGFIGILFYLAMCALGMVEGCCDAV